MLKMWLAVLAVLIGLGLSDAADTKSSLPSDKRWEQARKDWAQGKASEAKSAVEELLKDYPNEADAHLLLGMTKLRLRDPQGAILAAKQAIALDPQHIQARTFLAWIELEVRGDADAAIREYRSVIELRPELPEAYTNLAAAQKRRGALQEAIASLDKALELNTKFGTALNNRGWIYAEQEKWPQARSDFEEALKIDPDDQGALQGMALVLEKERNYAGAQQILARLNSRSPNFVYWLEWGRIGLIRYWWIWLSAAIAFVLRARFRKARIQANG
jgi:tetratricopeptide (TPR) repeat protein